MADTILPLSDNVKLIISSIALTLVTTSAPPGKAATLELGVVSTGAPGAPGSITNVGTPNAAIFNITLPLAGGTMAVQNANAVAITGGVITGITDLAVADGGTGASTAVNARANLGLTIGADVQAYSANLTSLAGVASTAAGRSLLSAADAPAQRTLLSINNVDNTSDANKPVSTATATALGLKLDKASNLSDLANAGTARTNLGLGIGVNVQAYAANLAALAGAVSAANKISYWTGAGTIATIDFTAAGRTLASAADATAQRTALGVTATGADATYNARASNLSDVANATTARGNLSAAKSGANSDITALTGLTTALSVSQGGTGDTGTAFTAYVPTFSTSVGALTLAAASGRYKVIGKLVFVWAELLITTNGTGAGNIFISMPFAPFSRGVFAGSEPSLSSTSLMISTSASNFLVTKYNGTYAGGDGARVLIGGFYEQT